MAFTYDKTTGDAKIYIDGIETAAGTATAALTTPTRTNAYIGKSNWPDNLFDGKMDELRVWNKARTATEITASKDFAIATHTNLVAAYHFDDNSTAAVQGSNISLLDGTTFSASDLPTLTYSTLNYVWSNAATTNEITVNTTNTYSVTTTNPYTGCAANSSIMVRAVDCDIIYTNTPTCQTVTINNVQGNQWFDFVNANGIVCTINPNGENLGTVTVEVSDAANAIDFNNNKFLGRTLNVISSAYPTGTTIPSVYSLRIYYYDTELAEYNTATSGTFTIADLNMAWKDGGTGCALASYGGSTNGLVDKANVTETDYGTSNNGFFLGFNLNHFTICAATTGAGAPLPIKLLSFTGYNKGNDNILEWLTATEINNAYFSVEYSANGTDFKAIGKVQGAGTTNTEQYYTFTHSSIDRLPPFGGIEGGFYRLRQVDFDGNFEYSNTIFIKNNNDKDVLNVYPNPTNDVLNISVGNKAQTTTLYSITGVLIYNFDTTPDIIDMQMLAAGAYILRVGGKVRRIVKE